jgi:hypothetical protein
MAALITLLYIIGGFVSIMGFVVKKKHAKIEPIHSGSCHVGCPDIRVIKDGFVFGGAAAFTLGLGYFLLFLMFRLPILGYYGVFQFCLTLIQIVTLFLQIPHLVEQNELPYILIKAHLQGCGYTTAWSILWPIYWLQKIPGLSGLVVVRDILTRIDYMSSLPILLLISIMVKLIYGKWVKSVLVVVDLGIEESE